MKKHLIYSIALSTLLYACGVSKNAAENTQSSEVVSTQAEDTVDEIATRPVYRATETKIFDLIHTKLAVKFDWEHSYLNGTAWITVKPHFYAQDSLVLDAKYMEILSVENNNKSLDYNYDKEYLTIDLGKTYKKNEELTVEIKYIAKPNEKPSGGSAAIMEDKGLYFINPTGEEKNKMPQIWTQGETEANSVWFPTIDAPNQKMTQEIAMTVDDKYVTLSNGLLTKSVKNADGTRTDYWETKLPFAPYLTMMAVGEFKIVKDSYTKSDGTKIEVNYYVEPEWEQYARDIFGQTPEMINFFSDILKVEYPWAKYSQIVVRDYVSGAMENVGAVIFGDFTYKTRRELLDGNSRSTIAHELFHHWFGDLVTTESWSNLPLNESFANYSQYLWDEYKEGIDEADYKAFVEARGYFQASKYKGYHDLIWYTYGTQEQMFDAHSYNKGGRILHMLRNIVGDSAFFTSLHVYLTENKFGTAEIDNLRLAFEKVTGEDLHWFFNQWFLAKGHPVLNVYHETKDGEVTVTIEQKQDLESVPLYRLPMKISVFDGAKRNDYNVVLDMEKQTFTFPIKDSLSTVIVDADHVILADWNKDVSPEEAIFQFYHGGKFMDRKQGLYIGVRADSEEGKQIIFDALKDPFYVIRNEAIDQSTRVKRDYKEKLVKQLMEMAKNDPISSVRVNALTFLLDNFKDESGIKALTLSLLESDSSYLVAGKALFGLAEYDTTLAMKHAKKLENANSQAVLSQIALLYGKFGNDENYDFFANTLTTKTISGMNIISFLSGFTNFVSRGDMKIKTKALDLYALAFKNGGIYAKIILSSHLQGISDDLQGEINKLKASETPDQAKITATKALKEKYDNLLNKLHSHNEVKVAPSDED